MLVLRGTYRYLRDLAFSPDGRTLASFSVHGRNVWLWDLASGRKTKSALAGHSRINSLAFAPSGTRLVTGDHRGRLRVWDISTRATVADLGELGSRFAAGGTIRCLAFTPDGRRVTAGAEGWRRYTVHAGGEQRPSG